MPDHPIIFTSESVRTILEGRKTQTRRVLKNWPPEIHLPYRVRGDFPIGHMLIAEPGIYTPVSNPLGALSVLVDGKKLGVKPDEFEWVCPYGDPGDRLWVRETWKVGAWREDGRLAIDYKASPELVHTPWVTIPDDPYGDKFNEVWRGLTDHLMDIKYPLGDDEQYHWEPGQSPFPWRSPIFMPRWASRITLELTEVRVGRVQEINQTDAKAEGAEPWWLAHDGLREMKNGVDFSIENVPEDKRDYVHGYQLLWDSLNARRGYPWASNPWVWVLEFKLIEAKS